MNTECIQCNKPIPKTRGSRNADSPPKYCSDACGNLFRRRGQGHALYGFNCATCGNRVEYRARGRMARRYCSVDCRRMAQKATNQATYPDATLSSATVGAISELIIAADLLRQGFEVFRALSPSCSCDLAILYKSKLIRVEVRTARRTPLGKLSFAFKQGEGHRHDVLALVGDDGRTIEYRPLLSDLFTEAA